jgi:hypothetical protein
VSIAFKLWPQKTQSWRSFEDAFRVILSQHQNVFGIEAVESAMGSAEGKSGYIWNIEVIAYTSVQRKKVLFEVRRRKGNVTPGEAAEVAFRIEDTGAAKGYFVTPLGRAASKGVS